MTNGVREIDEPTLVRPLFVGLGLNHREKEVGGTAPGLERGREVGHKFFLLSHDKLDLLAGLLLECGDSFPDRLVFLGGLSLLPPHHEVGGLCAERRKDEWRGDKTAPRQCAFSAVSPPRHGTYSLRICLIRAIASSTACSGLTPSAATRWIALDQTRSL